MDAGRNLIFNRLLPQIETVPFGETGEDRCHVLREFLLEGVGGRILKILDQIGAKVGLSTYYAIRIIY